MSTLPTFNFSNDPLASGLASDLYGYSTSLGLSSNQAALGAASIAAPIGTTDAALQNQLLGSGIGLGNQQAQSTYNAQSWLDHARCSLGIGNCPTVTNANAQGQMTSLIQPGSGSGITFSRVTTIVIGAFFVIGALYLFGTSSVTSALQGLKP